MVQDREPRAQLLPPDAVCTPSCGQTRPGHPLHPARGSAGGRAPAPGSQGGSQGALQCVVVVLEALQLQEVFGTFALLAGRQVGDLDGGGAGDFRGEGEVLRCRLVLPLAAASPGLGPAGIEKAPSPVLLSPERPLNPHVCLSGMRQVCPQDTALTVVLQSKASTSVGARPGARTRFPAHSGQHKQERGLRPDPKPQSARTDGLPGARRPARTGSRQQPPSQPLGLASKPASVHTSTKSCCGPGSHPRSPAAPPAVTLTRSPARSERPGTSDTPVFQRPGHKRKRASKT